MVKWHSDVATACFLKIFRKVTLPGILVPVSRTSLPSNTSLTKAVILDTNSSIWSISRQENVVEPITGMKPGGMSASPNLLPRYERKLLPTSCLKLAWFRFSTMSWRSSVMFSWILIIENEMRWETPSIVAERSFVLSYLALNIVNAKMRTMMNISKRQIRSTLPTVRRRRLHIFCLCFLREICSFSSFIVLVLIRIVRLFWASVYYLGWKINRKKEFILNYKKNLF